MAIGGLRQSQRWRQGVKDRAKDGGREVNTEPELVTERLRQSRGWRQGGETIMDGLGARNSKRDRERDRYRDRKSEERERNRGR